MLHKFLLCNILAVCIYKNVSLKKNKKVLNEKKTGLPTHRTQEQSVIASHS